MVRLIGVGIALLLMGALIQWWQGDTAGWEASVDLTVPEPDLVGVPLSVIEHAQIAQVELGPDLEVKTGSEPSTVLVTAQANSEDDAIRALGPVFDLHDHRDVAARRLAAMSEAVTQKRTSTVAELTALQRRIGDNAPESLGEVPPDLRDLDTTGLERDEPNENSSVAVVTDVLRLQTLTVTEQELRRQQQALTAAGASLGIPPEVGDIDVVAVSRSGFGWRDAFKVVGTGSVLLGLLGLLWSLFEGQQRRRLLFLGTLAVAVWSILVLSTMLQTRSDVRRANSIVGQTLVIDPTAPGTDLAGAALNVRSAEALMRRADSRLGSFWMQPIYAIPGLHLLEKGGRGSLSTAADALTIGATLASSAEDAQEAFKSRPDDRVGALQQLRSEVSAGASALDELAMPPRQWLPSLFRNSHDRAVRQLTTAEDAVADVALALDIAEDFLGTDGEWLLVGGSSADPRSAMGAFLATGTVNVGDGRVRASSLAGITNDETLDPVVAELIDLDIREGFGAILGNQRWATMGYSPRFPAAAEAAAELERQATGRAVRGVIYVDSVAIADLASAVEPVQFEGESYGGEDVLYELLRGQYLSGRNGTLESEDLGTQLAAEIMTSVLDDTDLLSTAGTLASAAEQRHVMVWSAEESLQNMLVDFGISGTVASDSLGVSLISASGKWGDWTTVNVAVSSECSMASGLLLNLDITLGFEEGPENVNPISRSHLWDEPRENFIGVLTVTLPGTAITANGGLGQFVVGDWQDGANRLASALVRLAPTETTTLTMEARLPAAADLAVLPSGRSRPVQWTLNDTVLESPNRISACSTEELATPAG